MPEMRQGPRINPDEIVRRFNEVDAELSKANEPESGRSKESVPEISNLRYEELSEESLSDAKQFVDTVFSLEKGVAGASLDQHMAKREARTEKIIPDDPGVAYDEQYWTVRDENKRLVGITGKYEVAGDKPDHFWLGWFALNSELRGSGMGKSLLDKVISEGRKTGKTALYLISSDHPDMAGNAKFYYKNDCLIVAVLNKSGNHIGKNADLSDEIIRKLCHEYGSFIKDGVNIFIRKKEIASD